MDSAHGDAGLRHDAFVYDSDAQYCAEGGGFLEEGLAAGEAAVVAGTRDRLAVMRDTLGSTAKRVTFVDIGSTYTRPARTLGAYSRILSRELQAAPSVRALAEVQYGPTPGDWREWMAYEAISSCAYAHLPAWVVCTYNRETSPHEVLDAVWQAHSQVLDRDSGWTESPHFGDPASMVRAQTPEPEALPHLRTLPPGDDLEAFRERLSSELNAAGVPPRRSLEMLLAATEVAKNAWEHGGGPHELRVGRADGRFVCEVSDRGTGFADPLAGYIVPRGDGRRGAGLWIARQMAWRVEIMPASPGVTVRLWA
jgi:anti-sigma regulatory factor (Ser/Thr protein kinase)